jgi:hypothetical protein
MSRGGLLLLPVYSRTHMTLVAGNKLPFLPRLSFCRKFLKARVATVLCALVAVAYPASMRAGQSANDPLALVKLAMKSELDADENDHSRWRYRDEEREIQTVSIVVQTDQGSVKRVISRDGRPLDATEAREEDVRINRLIHDPARLAKQKKDGEQDDKSARELLLMLPEAFRWTIESENGSVVKLHFEPNPDFRPPNLQSRVLAAMNGAMVIDKVQHRIETISGTLTEDVTFGFGFFGRMRRGGTFRVERRELAPGLWQITETHVHIEGKALLFKSIGQQQDEVQTDYKPVAHGTTLEQAAALSKP